MGGGGLDASETVLLSDVEEPPVERLLTGICDTVFGGGIVRTTVNLIGGSPGAGKSTLALQLTDACVEALVKAGEPERGILYVPTEQGTGELRGYAKRLGLKHLDKIRLPKNTEAARALLQSTFADSFRKAPPGFLILDSLNGLCSDDHRAAVEVCKRLKESAVEFKMPCFVISHITKQNDFAGLMQLQHDVDAVTTIFKSSDGMRDFHVWKNRWGADGVSQFYRMTEGGLVYDDEYTKAQMGWEEPEELKLAKKIRGKME